MYRCKECQAKYKNKMDYCDCGNNTFDYIEDIPQKKSTKQEKIKPVDKLKRKSEIISWTFFVICVILSALIWAFAGSSVQKTKSSKPKIKKQQSINKNIPNINNIWDDTPLYKPQPQNTEQQTEVINENNPIPLTSTPADYLRRIKEQQKISQQPIQQPKPAKPSPSPIKPKIIEKPKVIEKPPVNIPKYNPNDPELLEYKSLLRNALFSKFPVGSIQGSGTCIIEFSVNKETGKLENRRFAQQSENKALNDSIYYMLMSVPKFNIPPDSYNGEKIRMKFYLNNGNYEISFL